MMVGFLETEQYFAISSPDSELHHVELHHVEDDVPGSLDVLGCGNRLPKFMRRANDDIVCL